MKRHRLLTSLLACVVLATLFVASSATAAQADTQLVPQNHTPDGLYHPLDRPVRFLDTRSGTGGWTGALGVGQIINVQIAGRLGIPAASQVKAVALNVTAVTPTTVGFITIWPTGAAKPDTSNVNFTPGLTIPNFVIVSTGTNGEINAYNDAGRTHLLFDVVGWYGSASGPAVGGSYTRLDAPVRVLDTRAATSRAAAERMAVPPNSWFKVTDPQYVSLLSTYVFNVTVTDESADGFLSIVPGNQAGQPVPTVSNLNFRMAVTVANMVFVKPDAQGVFSIYNGSSGALHVILDLVGFFDDGSQPTDYGAIAAAPNGPFRFSDSRINLNRGTVVTGTDGFTVTFDVAGDSRIPATADALIVNLTVVTPTGGGYVSLFPGPTRPSTSTANFLTGQTVPNLTILTIGADRKVRMFVSAGVGLHAIIDVMGWFD